MRWSTRSAPLENLTSPVDREVAARADTAVVAVAGLGEALSRLRPEGGGRILDLGPSVAANFEQYRHHATEVGFVDLAVAWRDEPPPGGRMLPARVVRLLRSTSRRHYDLTLAWDLLNHLADDEAVELVRRIARASRRGARLHALMLADGELCSWPARHVLEAPDRVSIESRPGTSGRRRRVTPADLERRLRPFDIARSVVLRHGVREIVAVHP